MIIYIDDNGKENIIRSDELITKLIKDKVITEKTLLKTDIAGDWLSAVDFDLYKEISGNSPSIIEDKNKKEKRARELKEDYLNALKESEKVTIFKKKWKAVGVKRDEKSKETLLIHNTKDFNKSEFWLVSLDNNFELFLGRVLNSNIGALTADNNRWAKELFEGIYEITEGEEFITKETALAKEKNGVFQIQTLGKIQIPKKSIKPKEKPNQIEERQTILEKAKHSKEEIIESSVPSSRSINESKISKEEKTYTEKESQKDEIMKSEKMDEKIKPEKKDKVKSFPVMTKENNINTVRFFLYLCIGAGAITLIADIYSYNFLSSFKDPYFVYTEEIGKKAGFHDSIISNISWLYLIIMIPAYFFGGRWIYRSNLNLQNISKNNLRFSPGWSVGWYFIPIMSIWKPYQAMKEIYLTSVNTVNPNINNQFPGFFIIWWLLWILGNYLGWMYFRIAMKAEELNEIIDITLLGIGFDIIDITATLLFLKIVMLINEMHKKIFNK